MPRWRSRRGLHDSAVSFDADISQLHHLAVSLDLHADEAAEFLRCAALALLTLVQELLLDVRQADDAGNLPADLFDDRPRRPGGREHSKPRLEVISRKGLRHRGHIG